MTHSAPAAAARANLRRRRRAEDAPEPAPEPAPADPPAKPKPAPTPAPPSPPPLSVAFTLADLFATVTLFSLAVFVRFYRLDHIRSVIFDEVHYLNFDNYILNRSYFFDVNPVFGKLVIAWIANLLGYDPSVHFETLGQPLSQVKAFAARAPAAIFGALTVPVFYRVCRLLRLSTFASFMGATFILLDMMHISQSRIAMVDSVLVFFTCVAFYSALLLWDAKNVVVIKRRAVTFTDTAYVLAYLILTGVLCGLSVSVRWTAFATPALIFTISFFGVVPFCKEPLNFLELCVLYGSAFLSYCGSFAAFLLTANQSGPGDGFMSQEFQACLAGSKFDVGEGCKMGMWARILELNKTIFRYSKGIRGNDKWGSSWFQWIVNWRGALYYRQQDGPNIAMIYVLMNPVMALSIDGLMGLFVGVLFYRVRYRKGLRPNEAFRQHLKRGSALFFGWLGSMLPTMVVYRSGPVYQYLPGLFFAQALGAVGFDLIPPKLRPFTALMLTSGMVAAFAYWSPWVYGLPLSQLGHIERRWLPRWD